MPPSISRSEEYVWGPLWYLAQDAFSPFTETDTYVGFLESPWVSVTSAAAQLNHLLGWEPEGGSGFINYCKGWWKNNLGSKTGLGNNLLTRTVDVIQGLFYLTGVPTAIWSVTGGKYGDPPPSDREIGQMIGGALFLAVAPKVWTKLKGKAVTKPKDAKPTTQRKSITNKEIVSGQYLTRTFRVSSPDEVVAVQTDVAKVVADSLPDETITKLGWKSREAFVEGLVDDSYHWSWLEMSGEFPNTLRISDEFNPKSIRYVADNLDILEPPLGRQAVEGRWAGNGHLYHGTNAASFPGIIEQEALVPGGVLLKDPNAKPPFVPGEQGYAVGSIEGRHVNVDSISTVRHIPRQTGLTFGDIGYAERYSGWNPKLGNEQISKFSKIIARYEEELVALRERLNSESLSPEELTKLEGNIGLKEHFIESFKGLIEVEERRLKAWDVLSPEDRILVENPFPIVVRIVDYDPSLARGLVNSSVPSEVPYSGRCKLGQEVDAFFVPEQKIGFTSSYLEDNGIAGVAVYSLELLRLYRRLTAFIFPGRL